MECASNAPVMTRAYGTACFPCRHLKIKCIYSTADLHEREICTDAGELQNMMKKVIRESPWKIKRKKRVYEGHRTHVITSTLGRLAL